LEWGEFMSLLIIAYCLLLRALNAFHHEKAVVAFSPNAAAAFLWNGSGDHGPITQHFED
jgi:hypothetical protein